MSGLKSLNFDPLQAGSLELEWLRCCLSAFMASWKRRRSRCDGNSDTDCTSDSFELI